MTVTDVQVTAVPMTAVPMTAPVRAVAVTAVAVTVLAVTVLAVTTVPVTANCDSADVPVIAFPEAYVPLDRQGCHFHILWHKQTGYCHMVLSQLLLAEIDVLGKVLSVICTLSQLVQSHMQKTSDYSHSCH